MTSLPPIAIRRSPSSSSCAVCASFPMTVRAHTTKELALQIRALPVVPNKLRLAGTLANCRPKAISGMTLCRRSRQRWLRLCASSLPRRKARRARFSIRGIGVAGALRAHAGRQRSSPVCRSDRQAGSRRRQTATADFTLRDLQGKTWNLKDLRGKVVLVNFWATCVRHAAKKCPTWMRCIHVQG